MTTSLWLARFIHLLPQGEILDLASGAGRNCAALLAHDHRVVALDRDPQLLVQAAQLGATTLCHDLEAPDAVWPFETQRFAGIVVCNYLHRALFPFILSSLAPGGILLVETFAQGNERFGKPSNPAFLLAPDELIDLVKTAALQPFGSASEAANEAAIHIVAYECGYVEQPKPAIIQRICIKKSAIIGAALNSSP